MHPSEVAMSGTSRLRFGLIAALFALATLALIIGVVSMMSAATVDTGATAIEYGLIAA
jgi:Flp pilus assembly pilin Flp